jgi:hypothetical protein
MRLTKKRAGRNLFALLLAAGFAGPLLPRHVNSTQSFPRVSWRVEYQTGTIAVQKGTRLKLAFISQESLSNLGATVFSIPLEHLAAVYLDEKKWRLSTSVSQMPRSGCHYADLLFHDQMKLLPGTPPTLAILAVPANLTAMGAIPDRLLFKHPIGLFWNEGTAQESVVVNVNECEYGPFLSILQAGTGARWSDVKHEWSTIRPGRSPMQSPPISVQIDRRVLVGTTYLKVGFYTISLFDGPPGQKILLFFDPKGHVKALARARVTSETKRPSGIHLDYASRSGTTSLTQIVTPRIALMIENQQP